MFLKIFYIIFFLLYQTVGYTKTSDKNDFNYKYLSSYFSALISFDNQKNNKALEFFESSKYLKKKHNNYLKEYVYSLVLDGQKTDSHFLNLINSAEGDYSRYLFFYLSNVIENKDYKTAKQISKTIEPFSSTLLISQSKEWIDNENYKKFNNHFSCQNENDLLSEFFFLISNLYSSQNIIETSNFYLSVSNYLNPKFYFNLSLLAENYYDNDNFDISREILEKFSSEDET